MFRKANSTMNCHQTSIILTVRQPGVRSHALLESREAAFSFRCRSLCTSTIYSIVQVPPLRICKGTGGRGLTSVMTPIAT